MLSGGKGHTGEHEFPELLDVAIAQYMTGPLPDSLRGRQISKEKRKPSAIKRKEGKRRTLQAKSLQLPTPPMRRRCAASRVIGKDTPLDVRLHSREIPTEPLLTESWVALMVRLGAEDATLMPEQSRRAREISKSLSLTDFERRTLLSAGMKPDDVSRLFRALFVYSFGVYECIQDVSSNLEGSNKDDAVTLAWQVYLRLLEQIPKHHKNLLDVFIGADATEDLKSKIEYQESRHKNMLATQTFLEDRVDRAREKTSRLESLLSESEANLEAANSRIQNQDVYTKELEEWKQKAAKKLEIQSHEILQLKKTAMKVNELQDQVNNMAKDAKLNLAERKRLTAELSDGSRSLQKCKEELSATKFRLTMVEKSRNRIKSSLGATSAKLRERTQEKSDCEHEIYNLKKENNSLHKSLNESNKKNIDLRCHYEASRMEVEDLLARTSSMMRRVQESETLQNKKMEKATKAIAEAEMRDKKINEQMKIIASERSRLEATLVELQRVHDQAILQGREIDKRDCKIAQLGEQIFKLEAACDSINSELQDWRIKAEDYREAMLEAQKVAENCKDRAKAADEERHRAAVEFQALEEGLRVRVENAQKCLGEQAAKFEKKLDIEQGKILDLKDSCKHKSERIQELSDRAGSLADELEACKVDLHKVTGNESRLIALLNTASHEVSDMVSTARLIVKSKAEDFKITFANIENALLSSSTHDKSDINSLEHPESGSNTSFNSKSVFSGIDLTHKFIEVLENLNKSQVQEIFNLTNALKASEGALEDTKSALFRQEKLNTEISTELENYVADVKYLNDKIKKEQLKKKSIKEDLAQTAAKLQEEKKNVVKLEKSVVTLEKSVQGTKHMLKQAEERANEKIIETQKIMENLQEKNDSLEETLAESIEKVREGPERSEVAVQTELAAKELAAQEIEDLVLAQEQKRTEMMRAHMMDASTETYIMRQEASTQTADAELPLKGQSRIKAIRVQTSERDNESLKQHKGNARSFEPESQPNCEILTVKSLQPITSLAPPKRIVQDMKEHGVPDNLVASLLKRAASSRVTGLHTSNDPALFGALWSNRGGAWLMKFQESMLEPPKNICGFESWDPKATL